MRATPLVACNMMFRQVYVSGQANVQLLRPSVLLDTTTCVEGIFVESAL